MHEARRCRRRNWSTAALASLLMVACAGCFPPYLETHYATPTAVVIAPTAAPVQVTTPVIVPREVTPSHVAVVDPEAAAPPSPFTGDGLSVRIRGGPGGASLEVRAGPAVAPSDELREALALMGTGHHQQAAEILERLAQQEPTSEALFNLAVCHDQLRNTEEAMATYHLLEDDQDFGAYARARLAHLSEQPVPEPDRATMERARQEFVRGMELFESGSQTEAISAFQRSYDLVHHPRILFNLAVCYQRVGRDVTAASYYHLVVREAGVEEQVRAQARTFMQGLVASGTPSED